MRMQHEAIMVGVGTVVEDDPLLTVRLPGFEGRSPVRVVVDPFARMPRASRMLAPDLPARTIVLVSGKASRRSVERLRDAGAELHVVGSDYRGRFEPREILRALGLLGIKSVLLEGGAGTARRFLDSGMVDRIALFEGRVEIGPDGVDSPVTPESVPPGYQPGVEVRYGEDLLLEYERKD
jgi:diaminohydroxyphosphoribosylaminopyrimidine deaminase/5-amino-6-(5-phosphoribosylamino)uracil reductase